MEILNTLSSGSAWSIGSDGSASFANVNVTGAITINDHNVVTEDVASSAIISGNDTTDNTYTVTFSNGVADGTTSAKIPSYTSRGIADIESAHDGFLADANMINDILDYVDGSIADLVNGAPTTLDTLDEIAAALKDNASIVDTLEAAIGSKANAADVYTKSQVHQYVGQEINTFNENLGSASSKGVTGTSSSDNSNLVTSNWVSALLNDLGYIESGSQTTTSSADGGSNIFTFTKSDGTTSTFTVKNGSKGSKGDIGIAAGFGTPTASVDSGTGTPTVTITASGANTAKVFNFAFKNLKGAKGDPGTNGTNGTNGTSVTITNVSQSTAAGGTSTVTFSDGKTLSIKNGTNGVNATTTSVATTSANGLMSSAMVTKLNGIAAGATAVTSSTVSNWGYATTTLVNTAITEAINTFNEEKLGVAASYGVTTSVSTGSTNLITSGGVYSALADYLSRSGGTMTGTLNIKQHDYTHSFYGNSDGELVISGSEFIRFDNDIITQYSIYGNSLSLCNTPDGETMTKSGYKFYNKYKSWFDDTVEIHGSELYGYDSNGDEVWYIDADGSASFLSVSQTSDLTRKNILSYDPKFSVHDIANAPVAYFTWSEGQDTTSQHLGSIAQYWKTCVPECVNGEDGNMSMEYSTLGLVSAIVNAREIVKHEDEINALKQRVKALEIKLTAYEI